MSGPELARNLLPALGVVAILILVSRPLSVWLSTIGSRLTSSERAYVAAMAPRGIVAASVSALFGLRLEERGVDGGADLAALTFLVVAGTVVVYGAAATPLARRLRVDVPKAGGVILVGVPAWAAELGGALADLGVPVLVVAPAEEDIERAVGLGLLVYTGRLQSEELDEAVKAVGAKFALVASNREEVAAFAADRLGRLVGRDNLYVVPSDDEDYAERSSSPSQHWGQVAFGGHVTLEGAARLHTAGATCYALPMGRADLFEHERALVCVSDEGIPTIVRGDPSNAAGTLVVLGHRAGQARQFPMWATRPD